MFGMLTTDRYKFTYQRIFHAKEERQKISFDKLKWQNVIQVSN